MLFNIGEMLSVATLTFDLEFIVWQEWIYLEQNIN